MMYARSRVKLRPHWCRIPFRLSPLRLLLMLSLSLIVFLFIFGNVLGENHRIFVRKDGAYLLPHSLSLRDFNKDEVTTTTTKTTARPRAPGPPEQKCMLPSLQLEDALMMSHVKRPPTLACPQRPPDWAYIDNGTLVYTKETLAIDGGFTCDLSPMVRPARTDDRITWGPKMKDFPNGEKIPSDVVKLECYRRDKAEPTQPQPGPKLPPGQQEQQKPLPGKPTTKSTPKGPEYTEILWGVTPQKHSVWKRLSETKPPANGLAGLSVVMLGFDSMSRMSWTRRMKSTRDYVVGELGGIELHGYNIMGDGTPAALFPILTGKHEQELPEARRKHKGAKPVDDYPWIWKDFAKVGYVTSWADAEWTIAPFNYRLLGFAEPPTDHFARPYYLAIRETEKKHAKFCRGPVPKHQVWLDYVRDLHLMYGNNPKFLMHFYATLSHGDNNLLMHSDQDLKSLIQDLERRGYLNSTILVLFGDHGARFANLRETWAGKLEERLPYIMFRFPPWFERKYPDLMRNFRKNVHRLTTPLDLHETLRDVIKFGGAGDGDIRKRGISLFQKIPIDRECSHADISTHWCACLDWKQIKDPEVDEGAKSAALAAVKYINSLTESHRDLCAELNVSSINFAAKTEVNDAVLTFQKAADNDGYRPLFDQNAKSRVKEQQVSYQVTFHTTPGEGSFEVTLSQKSGKWSVSEKEISRINAYGKDPECILDINRQLRQFCYCTK